MAARKAAPQDDVVDAVEVGSTGGHHTGLDARDITLSRIRVVGKQADILDIRDDARPGMLMVGEDSTDEDATLVKALDGAGGIRFYVLKVHANYACGFNGPKGQWEEGDPSMPPDAKRQYTYTLFCPDHDDTLPILYTAGGTAAREARKVNKKLAVAGISGDPVELCFEISTTIRTGGTNSWPGPVFKLVESVPAEVAAAKAMRDTVVGPPRAQLTAGSDADTPGF